MTKTPLIALFSSTVAWTLASGQEYTVTFDGPPTQAQGTQILVAQYSELGFMFQPTYGPAKITRNGGGSALCPEDGSAYLQTMTWPGQVVNFYAIDGSAFDLLLVDLAEYSTRLIIPEVTFNGTRVDGTIASVTFPLDGIIDGTGPLADFQTFAFGPDFSDLVSVNVPTVGYSLDNLVVVVPEPSSLALTTLGAAGLMIARRRR